MRKAFVAGVRDKQQMGDRLHQFLQPNLTLAEARTSQVEVREWLLRQQIINAFLADNTLGRWNGYPPGPSADRAMIDADQTRSLITCGVAIIADPSLCINPHGFGDYHFRCHACGGTIDEEYFFENIAANAAAFNADPDTARSPCPICNTSLLMREWRSTGSVMQFTNFYVAFFNWNLRESFISEFSQLLGEGTMSDYHQI